LHELQQDYPDELAIIAWHTGDEFEFPGSTNRTNWWGVTAFPTVWFDGYTSVVGGYQPSSYPYYVPVMQERVPWPSSYEVFMEITNTESTDYNVSVRIDKKFGNTTENLAAFVVLTETDVPSAGNEDQAWVARSVFPDATSGFPVDFSVDTTITFSYTVTIEDAYVLENCEVIAFIENMETKEIYQGTSLMVTEVTTNFPPPTNLAYQITDEGILLSWDEPVTDALVGFNIYHSLDNGPFEIMAFSDQDFYEHVLPEVGLHKYYITAVYVTEESEESNTVEVLYTSIGEDISRYISVYPVPASERICIKGSMDITGIRIYDATGRLVDDCKAASHIVSLNVANYAAGLYNVIIRTNQGTAYKRMMIE
jgi:hypothetical protein